jgi:hypothetical protein
MTQRISARTGPVLAVVRVLVTLALLGAALVDGHKWTP